AELEVAAHHIAHGQIVVDHEHPAGHGFGHRHHQFVSRTWLTTRAIAAPPASQPRRERSGSKAAPATSHTANGSQIRSVSALESPERSAVSTASVAPRTRAITGWASTGGRPGRPARKFGTARRR